MDRSETTRVLLEAKRQHNLSWSDLSRQTGMGELYLAALFYGESSAPPEVAKQLVGLLDLPAQFERSLTEYPLKGNSVGDKPIPTDPFLYRFYEILAVYGLPLKDVVQEKCGDGIVSAVDFTMDVERVADPKGDRIKVTMNGKFLPYKRW